MTSHGAHERATGRTRRRQLVLAAGTLALVVGLGTYALTGTRVGTTSPEAPASLASARQPAVADSDAPLAPNGTYTTASGATATIASLRGTPVMVWFVAGGCASCAASIPAVAAHLHQLTGHGLRVLTLGLYGDFAAGKKGVAQLLSFGKSAAGFARESIDQPGWSWGMASKALSLAYDPAGIPDYYVLVGPHGHIQYRNNVPGSTMPQLLAAASRLSGARVPTSYSRPAVTAATLP